MPQVNEDAIVERLRKLAQQFTPVDRELVLGIGDDCAILRPRRGEDLLLKTDQLIERVHFKSGAKPEAIGARALARPLSDIAAMGGEPRYCLVALAVPRETTQRWMVAFFRGLLRLARSTATMLAGGDLAHCDTIHCTVMVVGAVKRGKALRRDGARPGDGVFVSGRLGKPWDRTVRLRLALARELVGRATACMDVSDGLALDLHRLCRASGVSAELDSVPLVRGASLERGLHGGEDYELLFTLPAGRQAPRGSFRMGRIVEGQAGAVWIRGRRVEARGYEHFGGRA